MSIRITYHSLFSYAQPILNIPVYPTIKTPRVYTLFQANFAVYFLILKISKGPYFKPFLHFYLCTLVNKTTLSTWHGCSTKNILNPYCTREWWNALFLKYWGYRACERFVLHYFFRISKFSFLSSITSILFLFTNQYLMQSL